ncbi:RDD family protein [Kitasatospora acidiphila]|uniref:RDD family protein n=1 Tax=Kitasatospora acidiphila TaxID=2567942 RepID=A0A540W9W5_9ACTN|nr:RDD family protein [Kitasatospora acidiphila]TQF05184.1 RDD family protein [Kitasatospora acidiphila]
MSDLVTGEAVVLGLRTAKLPSRALAVLIDLAVEVGGFFLTTLVLLTVLTDLDNAAAAALVVCLMVLFLVAVPVAVETLSRGRSLGKLAMGLRVVRLDGGPIRFRHALVRGLVGTIEIMALSGVPAAICSLISSDGRRLGDIFGGTLVVRERVPAARAGMPTVTAPPQLLAAVGNDLVRLDLSAVPPGLWLAIRQLLGRTGQLDEEVALRMAHQLAGDLASRVHWPVPPGLHPALYLSAVLTERQRRDWQRTAGAFAANAMQPGGGAQPLGWGAPAHPMTPAMPPGVPMPGMPAAPMPSAPAMPAMPAPLMPAAPVSVPLSAPPTAPMPAADSSGGGTGFALPG